MSLGGLGGEECHRKVKLVAVLRHLRLSCHLFPKAQKEVNRASSSVFLTVCYRGMVELPSVS